MNNFKEDWIIFETITGSNMYGTNTPESDLDLRGICIPSYKVRNDPFQNFEQQTFAGEDRVIYTLQKFFELAAGSNPTIIEFLFVSEYGNKNLIKTWTPEWIAIWLAKEYFLSNVCKKTFVGYARQQLERIKRHSKWMGKKFKEPKREDFGLEPMPKFSYEKLMSLLTAPVESIQEDYREYAINEMRYKTESEEWKKYLVWQKERNPARHALEEKFGYDTKHAMHLYRLLSEGIELVSTGNIYLPRPDRKLLLEIRDGKYSYDEILEIGNNLEDDIDSVQSVLPEKPYIDNLRELYYNILYHRDIRA